MIAREEKWVIMSKDRTLILKGTTRKRMLPVSETKKRTLTYHTKALAQATVFDYSHPWRGRQQYDLEVVPVIITIEEVSNGKNS